MNNRLAALLLIPVVLLTLCSHGEAAVELDASKTWNIDETILDVAVSVSGIFVLTQQGSILIYSGDGKLTKTLDIKKTPLDIAVSSNGRWVFVLTQQGSILIYSGDGKLEDEVSVGKHIDGIEVGPREEILILSNRKNKSVQILFLAFIQNFDTSNSPFKGRVDAPVEIAVFGDFQ